MSVGRLLRHFIVTDAVSIPIFFSHHFPAYCNHGKGCHADVSSCGFIGQPRHQILQQLSTAYVVPVYAGLWYVVGANSIHPRNLDTPAQCDISCHMSVHILSSGGRIKEGSECRRRPACYMRYTVATQPASFTDHRSQWRGTAR